MAICAKQNGKRITDCTRGIKACQCIKDCIRLTRRIAYPRRGTPDEHLSLEGFAEEIQKEFTHDDLS